MFRHNITRVVGIDVAIDPVAAGATDANGKVIDTLGYESIAFAINIGTITSTAVTGLKIQSGALANGSDMADVAGSAVAIADTQSNKVAWSAEVHRPSKRYVRVVVTRATANAVVAGGVAILGRAGYQPAAAGANQAATTPAVPPVLLNA
ncbi:hypothetical protein [Paludisphaera mucosa]|uniref:DUF2190 family protein n=1 Tax=Paludisphaera mucosa TaxID=3030827 RepID=A0ABT6F6U7_9BACT|nr:hypothetical protein [Paludisphaera mucosa]MDG3003242.1 hypothetical protein [Paludisphaera mucosa]